MIPEISIIICTYNRAVSLLDTLKSLSEMVVPEGIRWEVIVVDNNSSDSTRKIVDDFIKDGHPNFRYSFESKQGKAFALNHGIKIAKSEILAFTDDDAIVDKHWLRLIIETFERYNADCVGGKILPIWLGIRPKWLLDNLLNILAILDYGDTIYEYNLERDDRMLFGANYAFKKEFFLNNGVFNVSLGSRGEDQEIFERLIKSKGRAIYNPEIIVRHKIFPERLEKSYFRRWQYESGKSMAMLDCSSRIMIFGIPGYMIGQFLIFLKNFLRSIIILDNHSIFFYELKLIYHFGFFKQKIRLFVLNRSEVNS